MEEKKELKYQGKVHISGFGQRLSLSCLPNLFIGQILESGRSINHNYQIVEPPLSNRNLHLSTYRYAIAGMLDGRALYSRVDRTTVSLSRY